MFRIRVLFKDGTLETVMVDIGAYTKWLVAMVAAGNLDSINILEAV